MKRFFILILIWILVLIVSISNVSLANTMGCTVGGITGSATFQNEVFIGGTNDNSWWPTRHTLWVIQPENGYKYIGLRAAKWGLETGINEKGFGFICTAVGATDVDDADPSGLGLLEIGPRLLEKCTTVDDAINILKNGKRKSDFWTRNVIMADALGNLALVEVSYAKISVATRTTDGYVVSTNHYTSDIMKPLQKKPTTDSSINRLNRGYEWFENWFTNQKPPDKMRVEDLFSPKSGLWSYIYQDRQGDLTSGPGTIAVIQPMKLTYWFNYGWPGGNLPTKENENRQICQNMTWGVFIPFYLTEMVPGQYTTELGQLTPMGMQYVYSHFSEHLQREPAWVNYQSEDPMKPYYKPAEDMSPSGYTLIENPYGPGGFVGMWTKEDGFIPCTSCPTGP